MTARGPVLIQIDGADPAAQRDELLQGLVAAAARVPPKYFYDALGSRLFAAITELPEYYLTRAEAAIFARHAAEMAAQAPPFATLVDLGAGNCEKAGRLFAAFGVRRYLAVDISAAYLAESLEQLRRHHPGVDLYGVGMDFSAHLDLPPEAGEAPRLMFYPGSSVGNFMPDEALAFLRRVRAAAGGGGLLIGVDLVKDGARLAAAYDDALQVTAAFNRNLLLHLNRLIDSDFHLADWRHVAFFNADASRIEMHLEARREVAVRWPGGGRRFEAGERIHTEHSYKWRDADFAALLEEAGYTDIRRWTDARRDFAVFLARA